MNRLHLTRQMDQIHDQTLMFIFCIVFMYLKVLVSSISINSGHSYRKVFAKTCFFHQTDKNNNFIVTENTFKTYLSYNSWAADA